MKRLFVLTRLFLYGYVGYHVYFVDWSIFVGFCTTYILLELLLIFMSNLYQKSIALEFAQEQLHTSDFEFSSKSLTTDEFELVDKIRDGDLTAATMFLSQRCNNKFLDFNLIPEVVRLILARKLVNSINRGEDLSWKELLSK